MPGSRGPADRRCAVRRRGCGTAAVWVVGIVGGVALLSAALAASLVATEWGAQLLWHAAERLAPGSLTGEFVGGTLRRGVSLMDVAYRNENVSIRIDHIESRWRWSLAPLALDVESLRIGTLQAIPATAAAAPRVLPDRLTLPLRIELRGARMDEVIVGPEAAAVHLRAVRLSASSDGIHHTIALEHATTPAGTASASLKLDGERPFALNGRAALRGRYREHPLGLDARLSGTLDSFAVRIDATGEKLNGSATIAATPFASLPFRHLRVDLRHFDARAWNAAWPRADVDVRASLEPRGGTTPFALTGHVTLVNAHAGALDAGLLPLLSAQAEVVLEARKQRLSNLDVRVTGNAALHGNAEIASIGDRTDYRFSGSLKRFNPMLFLKTDAAWSRTVRTADINGDVEARGSLRPSWNADIRFDLRDSRYGGRRLSGNGVLAFSAKRLLSSDAHLAIAGNRAAIRGSFGQPSDVLEFAIDAPVLDRLGFGLSGAVKLNGKIGGRLAHPVVNARYRAERLAYGDVSIGELSGEARVQGLPESGARTAQPLAIRIAARDLHRGSISFSRFDAAADGAYGAHTLRIDATGRVHDRPLAFTLTAEGGVREQADGLGWTGVLRMLESRGLLPISLASPVHLAVGPGTLDLGAGQVRIGHAAVDLTALHYDDRRIRSEGRIAGLDVGELLQWRRRLTGVRASLDTDLVLDADWNVTLGDTAGGSVNVVRRSGDLALPDHRNLGLERLSLHAALEPQGIQLDAAADARRIGTARGRARVALLRSGKHLAITPESAISGSIVATLPRLQLLAALAGPRVALEGSADVELSLGGSLRHPLLSGSAAADGLALNLYDQGIRLHDGSARLRMDSDVIELQRLEFHGTAGTLRATGRLPLDLENGTLTADIVADKLQLMSTPAQQLTVSGRANATNPGGEMRIDGRFVVDHARFSAPPKPVPKLGNDVVVIRGGAAHSAAQANPLAHRRETGLVAPVLNVEVNLGDDFVFEGSGANLRLVGDLKLRSDPREAPQAFGTVRVAKGSYEAFGTKLDIERGLITFKGPPTNPALDILAMRRNQDVPAGVQITGNVEQPQVEVVSEPTLPKNEQISWLVFGHATSGTGSQASAQNAVSSAALGLLGKVGGAPLAKAFGLSTLSLGESTTGLGGTPVVSLGKNISDRLSVGYEQSLAGTQGVLTLTYDLARSWSLVARGGSVAGLELLFSKRFDSR